MFDNLYGLYEKAIDGNRIILPNEAKEIGKEVLITKDDNDYYYIELLENLDKVIRKMKERSYDLSDQEFRKRMKKIEKIFLQVVAKIKIDKAGRITLPEACMEKTDGKKIYLLGQQDKFQLFHTIEDYNDYANSILNQKK